MLILLCFFSSIPVEAHEFTELSGCLSDYHADRIVYLDTKEKCIQYIYEQLLSYKGSVIIYTGEDFEQYTLDDVYNLLLDACRIDAADTLKDGPSLWGNIAAYQKGIAITDYGAVFCVGVEFKRSEEEMNRLDRELETIMEYLNSVYQISALDDEQRVKVIHDYLCERFDYDESFSNYTDYDGLFTKIKDKEVMVCQGYSLLAYKLFEMAGIESNILISETHSWNIVRINGVWYHIDITNDDRGLYQRGTIYKYYLRASLSGVNYEYLDDSPFYKNIKRLPFAKEDYKISYNQTIEGYSERIVEYMEYSLIKLKKNLFYIIGGSIVILAAHFIYNIVDLKWRKHIKKSKDKFRLYNSI